ncbi:MAG: FISUMP domain-containing protein [bacterium]
MNKIITLFLFLISYTVYSQSLSVFNVNSSAFPTIKANFFNIDAEGKQITNSNITDFDLKENGLSRKVTTISCPEPNPPKIVSIAMSIDISGSMMYSDAGESPVELGKTTAKDLCNSVPMPPSEFALQTCDSKAYILQDFTTDKQKLISKIDPITAYGDNDFVEQLLNNITGLLNLAKLGKYKRVAVLYTDAWWYALTDQQLQACKDTCSKYNIQFFAVIYSRSEAEPNGIKASLQALAKYTGGVFYDGITSLTAAKDLANNIQLQSQGGKPCEIVWESTSSCLEGLTKVELKYNPDNLAGNTSYRSPLSSIIKLEVNPITLRFKSAIPGIKKDTTIKVTAKNADFNITNIISSNPAYSITPTAFSINSGQTRDLTVSYLPADSGYTYTKFTFVNDMCPAKYSASGGFPGKKAKIQTLKIIHPNGGESFVVGMDTVISWDGVLEDEKVKIEYTTDNGINWIEIADSAIGLKYNWHVPKTPSNECLARVTARLGYDGFCPEVQICNQIWMGCNLDVDTYRNGDPIPEVTDSAEWVNATSGAWCYYNNDPAMGEIYGKIYNWYAIQDSRGLAPEGWHIPNFDEWNQLEDCLGRTEGSGGKLKSTGTIEAGDGLWYAPNAGATNEFGFSALPGGLREFGQFHYLGFGGFWWDSFEKLTNGLKELEYDNAEMWSSFWFSAVGCSVRCVKD